MIKYSFESLVHYQCSECKGYWTIADKAVVVDRMTCPHCDYRHNIFTPMEPMKAGDTGE